MSRFAVLNFGLHCIFIPCCFYKFQTPFHDAIGHIARISVIQVLRLESWYQTRESFIGTSLTQSEISLSPTSRLLAQPETTPSVTVTGSVDFAISSVQAAWTEKSQSIRLRKTRLEINLCQDLSYVLPQALPFKYFLSQDTLWAYIH